MTFEAMDQSTSEPNPEHRLWTAVVTKTVEEWVSGPLRRRRDAEKFLLEDNRDFCMVCERAGLDPQQLRARLYRLKGSARVPAMQETSLEAA